MFTNSKNHLQEAKETYFQHQTVAFRYSKNCLKAALMAFVHGLIPGWFQTSASDLVKKLAGNRKTQ